MSRQPNHAVQSKRGKLLAMSGFMGCLAAIYIKPEWLKYVFCANLMVLFIFAVLCFNDASRDKEASDYGLLSLLVLGTSRPTAKIKNGQALLGLFSALAFLVGGVAGVLATAHFR